MNWRKFIPYSTHKSIREETKMFDHFFKTCVAAVSDAEELNRLKDALSAAGVRYECRMKDLNRRNAFD